MEDQIRNPDECNDFSKNFLRKRNENNSIGQPSTSCLTWSQDYQRHQGIREQQEPDYLW